MKDIVTSHKVYAPWEYENEEHDLNEASKNGLQLTQPGLFGSKFRRDNSIRYVYQLDYNPKIKDSIHYRTTFEEQGWEYVDSLVNGWHYFRKPYVEGVHQDEYKIYTDKESLYEMHNRWLRLLTRILVLCLAMATLFTFVSIRLNSYALKCESLFFALFAAFSGLGIWGVLRSRKGKRGNLCIPLRFFIPVAFIFLLLTGIFMSLEQTNNINIVYQDNFSLTITADGHAPISSNNFTVDNSGDYILDIYADTNGVLTDIAIKSADGQTITEDSGMNFSIYNRNIYLEKEKDYTVHYSFHSDNIEKEETKVKVKLIIKESISSLFKRLFTRDISQ